MFAGHVYFVRGTHASIDSVFAFLAERGIEMAGNPDAFVRTYGSFGIDDARELIERAALKSVGERRVFVLALDAITAEAQNALLKTLEEPPGGALFFIIHPAPLMLLATVRSRGQILNLQAARPDSGVDAQAFIKATPTKRLDMLKPLLEKGDDDKRDLGDILAFLASLEVELAPGAREKGARQSLEALFRARQYIADRGALVKPLLEQLALLA